MRDIGGEESCAWRLVGCLLLEILPLARRAGSDDPGGVGVAKKSRRKSDWRQVALIMVVVGWVAEIDHMAKP